MYWGLLCSVYRIQSNVSTYADERKELINHNGTNDESKPRTPLKDKHYRNITECTIVTITVHFIRPIRDLALCERLAFLFRHIFYSVKKRRISVCSCVCHFVSIVFFLFLTESLFRRVAFFYAIDFLVEHFYLCSVHVFCIPCFKVRITKQKIKSNG